MASQSPAEIRSSAARALNFSTAAARVTWERGPSTCEPSTAESKVPARAAHGDMMSRSASRIAAEERDRRAALDANHAPSGRDAVPRERMELVQEDAPRYPLCGPHPSACSCACAHGARGEGALLSLGLRPGQSVCHSRADCLHRRRRGAPIFFCVHVSCAIRPVVSQRESHSAHTLNDESESGGDSHSISSSWPRRCDTRRSKGVGGDRPRTTTFRRVTATRARH